MTLSNEISFRDGVFQSSILLSNMVLKFYNDLKSEFEKEEKKTRGQFHQRSMHSFYESKLRMQFFLLMF